MKKIFIAILVLTSAQAIACPGVDESTQETVVMVDLNFVLGEVDTAKKAACEQGKKFVLLPYGYERHKELGTLREKIYRNDSYSKNNDCFADPSSARCQDLLAKRSTLHEEMFRKEREIKARESQKNLEEGFKALASEGKKVNSVILSGHDGSGSFYGKAGSTTKYDVVELLKDSYEDKPELLEDLNSVYLWGCYTATKAETEWWSKQLPQLDIVAGFHGTGPSIGKSASNTILYDLMMSENEIYNVQEKDEMEKTLKNLEGLPYLLSGIYVKTCGEEEYYLSRQKMDGHYDRLYTEFGPTGTASCKKEENNAANAAHYEKFMRYFTGELAIPEDTSNGELRTIYNFSRSWEHCKEHWDDPSQGLDPDKVALLLFYEGVKANFHNAFKDQLEQALEALESLPVDDLDYIGLDRSFFGWLPRKLKYEGSRLLQGDDHKSLADFSLKYKELLKNLPRDKEGFTQLSRKELNDYNKMLHELTSTDLHLYPGVSEKVKPLQQLKKAMNIYAYGLDSNCMDMLMWHEDEGYDLYNEGHALNGCGIE